MAECNWCDSKKWFFKLDKSGLCAECAPTVKAEIAGHIETLDAFDKPDAGVDWQTMLAHYDGVRRSLGALLQYEGCGISTIDPPPSAAITDCGEARAQVILGAARGAVQQVKDQIGAADDGEARRELLNGTLAQVTMFRDLLGEPLPEFGDNDATVLLKLQQELEALVGGNDS